MLGIFRIESIRIKTIRIAYTIHIIQNRATIHYEQSIGGFATKPLLPIHINQKIIYWTFITTNSYKSIDNLLAVFLQCLSVLNLLVYMTL